MYSTVHNDRHILQLEILPNSSSINSWDFVHTDLNIFECEVPLENVWECYSN